MVENYPAYLFRDDDTNIQTTIFLQKLGYDEKIAKEKWLEKIKVAIGISFFHTHNHLIEYFYLNIYDRCHINEPLTSDFMCAGSIISFIDKHYSKPESIRLEILSKFYCKEIRIILFREEK